jgi:hypothetical protein
MLVLWPIERRRTDHLGGAMSDSDANWRKRARHSPGLRDWQVRRLADRLDDQLELTWRLLQPTGRDLRLVVRLVDPNPAS